MSDLQNEKREKNKRAQRQRGNTKGGESKRERERTHGRTTTRVLLGRGGGGGVGPTHSRAQSPSPCPRLDQSRATVRTARRNHHHVLPTLSYDSSAAVAASPSPVHPRARERMREIAA